jgi:hypothetical protein
MAELPALLAELGVDAAEVFEGTGVDPATLDAETRITFGDLATILDRSVRLSGRPELGLLLGRRFRLEHHGAVGEMMRTAPTLGEALRTFVACQPGYSSGAVVYLHSEDGMTALGKRRLFGGGAAGADLHGPRRRDRDADGHAPHRKAGSARGDSTCPAARRPTGRPTCALSPRLCGSTSP